MSIGRCSRVTGKMLAAAGDPLPFHSLVERSRIADDLLDGFPVAPAAQRILSIVIKRNVQHRTKIEVETKEAQQPSSDIPVTPDQIDIVLLTQLLRVRRFFS